MASWPPATYLLPLVAVRREGDQRREAVRPARRRLRVVTRHRGASLDREEAGHDVRAEVVLERPVIAGAGVVDVHAATGSGAQGLALRVARVEVEVLIAEDRHSALLAAVGLAPVRVRNRDQAVVLVVVERQARAIGRALRGDAKAAVVEQVTLGNRRIADLAELLRR